MESQEVAQALREEAELLERDDKPESKGIGSILRGCAWLFQASDHNGESIYQMFNRS